MLLLGTTTVQASVNTVFDVPSFDDDLDLPNEVYKSPNKNVKADKWSYGLFGYILNTTNLDSLVAELVANVPATGHSRRGVSVYPNGSHLSDANIATLAGAGWNELELYYQYFYVIGSMPSAGLSPNVEKTDHTEIKAVLEGVGFTDEIAAISVSDSNMDIVNIGLYNQDLSFLNRGTCMAYKYMADVGVFVPDVEAYYGTYGSYVLEIYELQDIEADANGGNLLVICIFVLVLTGIIAGVMWFKKKRK